MLHVAVTHAPTPSPNSLQSSLELENLRAGPPLSAPHPQLLASLWHCLIFLFENKTLTTVFLVRACLRTLRGH